MAVSDPWRRRGRLVLILAVAVAVTSVLLPWFARISDLPADDDHMEELSLWMTGDAIGHDGPGPLDVLRVVPWGPFMLLATAAAVWAGIRALRSPGRHRGVALTAVWSAVAAFAVVGIAWVGAADGRDTEVFPHMGFVVGALLLIAWLAVALGMLRLVGRTAPR
ncbi:hypothetical protein [Virgisporangium ochraceum]|nr:hypothetical protein [Virgisporangium ochraceum]